MRTCITTTVDWRHNIFNILIVNYCSCSTFSHRISKMAETLTNARFCRLTSMCIQLQTSNLIIYEGYQKVLEITQMKRSKKVYFDMWSFRHLYIVTVQSYTFLRLFIDCPQTEIIMILKKSEICNKKPVSRYWFDTIIQGE